MIPSRHRFLFFCVCVIQTDSGVHSNFYFVDVKRSSRGLKRLEREDECYSSPTDEIKNEYDVVLELSTKTNLTFMK
jgi:hypothetical protein